MSSNRVFLMLATVMSFSLIMGLAVLVIVVRTAEEVPTPTPPVTIVQIPTSTPTAVQSDNPCVFVWAREDLPDTTTAAQMALDTAGIMNTTVRVEAYGENCLESDTQQVRYFAAMTTDFYFTASVDDLADEQVIAGFIRPLYNIAAAIPRDQMPAPPGYLDLTFTSENAQRHLRTRFDEAQAAIAGSLRGKALLDALGGLSG